MMPAAMNEWPALPLAEWNETKETLHRFTQVVGKIRLALTPRINHWWNVVLYVTPRGLTTSVIPYGDRWFDLEFDFLVHALRLRTSDGAERTVPLGPRSVADFHREVFAILKAERIHCRIRPEPCEIENPIPLDRDEEHHEYDTDYVERCWTILALSHGVFATFRAEFLGKCSPVHFFWGSFDLAVTRFSGRRAPPREGADAMTREAYSHEVSSVGFWPGDSRLAQAAFYSYSAPEPEGFPSSAVAPSAAYYNKSLSGFYLHYDDLRRADDPAKTLLDFCRSTYAAAADK
ncbi:MAG TPA: DUF5996 family protein, partial [Thermoanaerobaculia bacterium]|nr:DUF5996 family protein [Thermoanaerobaculia bacterium]